MENQCARDTRRQRAARAPALTPLFGLMHAWKRMRPNQTNKKYSPPVGYPLYSLRMKSAPSSHFEPINRRAALYIVWWSWIYTKVVSRSPASPCTSSAHRNHTRHTIRSHTQRLMEMGVAHRWLCIFGNWTQSMPCRPAHTLYDKGWCGRGYVHVRRHPNNINPNTLSQYVL